MYHRRLVIDTNFLGDERLEAFFLAHRENTVILTEFVIIEMHKHHSIETIFDSLAILNRHKSRVILAKNSDTMLRQATRPAGLANRLLDNSHTAKFRQFCGELFSKGMSDRMRRTLLENQARAHRKMDTLHGSAAGLPNLFELIASEFKKSELDELRRGVAFSSETQEKLIDFAFVMAKSLSSETVPRMYWGKIDRAANHFPFRYALAAVLLYTRWVAGGRQRKTKTPKIVNDMIDLNVACCGSYFNGILSADERLNDLHNELRFVLQNLNGSIQSKITWPKR